MKKIGLLHGELSRTIAELAHEDIILIGDAGMPVPEGVKLIDLAVVCGVPSFIDVLKAVMSEMLVAKGIIDMEQEEVSPQMGVKIREAVGKEPHTRTSYWKQTAYFKQHKVVSTWRMIIYWNFGGLTNHLPE